MIWSCDPMHGNDTRTDKGRKVREFEPILEELYETVQVLHSYELELGGLHCEVAGEEVAECLGGVGAYKSYCDPRLSYSQGMELAHFLSEVLAGSMR